MFRLVRSRLGENKIFTFTRYKKQKAYWSLASLANFFNNHDATIYRVERINTHGGSIRVYIKKGKKINVENSIKELIKVEEKFGIKKYQTYQEFAKKVYKIRDNIRKNIFNLKSKNNKIIGYGSPAKATTALNFFGISNEIECIVEDNNLKHGKYLPGMKIPIVSKDKIKVKPDCALVLAWNFMDEIKRKNTDLAHRFISIKDLEKKIPN